MAFATHHLDLEHGVRPAGRRVRFRGLSLAPRVSLSQKLHHVVAVRHLHALQPRDSSAALGVIAQFQRSGRVLVRLAAEQIVDELVVHLQVRARDVVRVRVSVTPHFVEDVRQRKQHHARVTLVPHHRVRLARPRGAVREDGAVAPVQHAVD